MQKKDGQLNTIAAAGRTPRRPGTAMAAKEPITRQGVEEELKKYGLRMTRQRGVILDFLSSSNDHPTAREVCSGVHEIDSKIATATVYNTLGVLVKLGFIRVLEFNSIHNRYETNLAPHVNMICLSCGKIVESERDIAFQEESGKSGADFEVIDYRLEYYGFCAFCRSNS